VLAAWNRIGAAQSLFYSFFAVLRNWRAFFVYGAVLALAGAIFLIILTFAALVVRERMQLLHSLALILTLVSWPTLFASLYASYRDIFPENAVPAEPPSNRESP
jgi:hypothetical protein